MRRREEAEYKYNRAGLLSSKLPRLVLKSATKAAKTGGTTSASFSRKETLALNGLVKLLLQR